VRNAPAWRGERADRGCRPSESPPRGSPPPANPAEHARKGSALPSGQFASSAGPDLAQHSVAEGRGAQPRRHGGARARQARVHIGDSLRSSRRRQRGQRPEQACPQRPAHTSRSIEQPRECPLGRSRYMQLRRARASAGAPGRSLFIPYYYPDISGLSSVTDAARASIARRSRRGTAAAAGRARRGRGPGGRARDRRRVVRAPHGQQLGQQRVVRAAHQGEREVGEERRLGPLERVGRAPAAVPGLRTSLAGARLVPARGRQGRVGVAGLAPAELTSSALVVYSYFGPCRQQRCAAVPRHGASPCGPASACADLQRCVRRPAPDLLPKQPQQAETGS